jgi:hypothetical protein
MHVAVAINYPRSIAHLTERLAHSHRAIRVKRACLEFTRRHQSVGYIPVGYVAVAEKEERAG